MCRSRSDVLAGPLGGVVPLCGSCSPRRAPAPPVRHPSVSGPLNVKLEGLPANVTGTVDPSLLTFPGGAVGETVHVRLTTIAGLTIPNTWIALHLTGPGLDISFPILLYGRCPQEA